MLINDSKTLWEVPVLEIFIFVLYVNICTAFYICTVRQFPTEVMNFKTFLGSPFCG